SISRRRFGVRVVSSSDVIRPRSYPLDKAPEAYDRMMSGKARFRVVLEATRSTTGTAATRTRPETVEEHPRAAAHVRDQRAEKRAGDRGRTGDVQLGKLSGPCGARVFRRR